MNEKRATIEELEETVTNLWQQIGSLEIKVEQMTKRRTDDGLNRAALEMARQIDDIFAIGGYNVTQRTARIQVLIRDNMRLMLEGEQHWDHS